MCFYLMELSYLTGDWSCLIDCSNKRILMFDSNFKLISTYPTAGQSRGVCTIPGNKEGLYVVCDNNKVVSYTFHGGWKETSRFDTESNLKNINCSDDVLIISSNPKIVIYNNHGQKLSEFPKFSCAHTYIAVATDGQTFYHRDNDAIVARKTKDQSEKFRYSNSSIVDPYGISCDRNGNLIVGCRSSSIVFQISQDGLVGRVLLDKLDSIKGIYSVLCHPHRDVFVITSANEDTVMEVYEFY